METNSLRWAYGYKDMFRGMMNKRHCKTKALGLDLRTERERVPCSLFIVREMKGVLCLVEPCGEERR